MLSIIEQIKRSLDAKGAERDAAISELQSAWTHVRPQLEQVPANFLKVRLFILAIALVKHRDENVASDLVHRLSGAEKTHPDDHDIKLLKSVLLRHCSIFAAVYAEVTEEE